VLATTSADQVGGLGEVAMSRSTTFRDTVALLTANGCPPVLARSLRDVDEVADARAVAGSAPMTLFAGTWAQ
jgi:glycosyltransferase A (GT-A) superfamily protein (DUF2064 family)